MGTPRVRSRFLVKKWTRRQLANRAMDAGLLTSVLCLFAIFAAFAVDQPIMSVFFVVITVTNSILMGRLWRAIKAGEYNDE